MTRRQRRRREQRGRIRQLPFVDLAATIGPLQALSLDQIEAIHHASLRVLSETGIEILSASARALFGDAGAEVDPATERVRMEPALVESLIRSCPAGWTFHARNAEHNVTLGGRSLNFCNATTPPYVSDLEGGRRIGSCVDFNDAVRLCQSLNILHFFYGYPVEPQDLPPETRHLDCYHAHATLSDKVWRAYALTLDRVTDAIEMARIARAVTREQMASEPSLMLNCNTNSPLKIDASMCDGAIAMARMGQPVVISAFTMAGAMAPVTMAGALVEQNAECLAGMALTQLARKGAPVVYGAFTSNVHMRSGAVSLGTPEYAQAALVGGQLARRYGVPYKSSNVNSSNAPDVQAVYESMMAIWSATLGGADIMAHGIGWLESGLTFSFEKAIIDAEMLQMMQAFMTPMATDQASLGVEAIARVGPGGHFFGDPHTLERYQTAFYEPMLSDWRPYDAWVEHGAQSATERAHGIWKQILAEYQPPAMDEAVREELDAYVARRKEEYARGA